MILCKHCGEHNNASNKICGACGASLAATVSELDIIRKEINALKLEYESKISHLLARIETYMCVYYPNDIRLETFSNKFKNYPSQLQHISKSSV